MLPMYCLTIVLPKRQIDLVFQSFDEIRELFFRFLIPLQYTLANKNVKIRVPTLGAILWRRFQYLILWRIGLMGQLSKFPSGKILGLAKIILMAKNYLLKEN